jgi:hypothetical protein
MNLTRPFCLRKNNAVSNSNAPDNLTPKTKTEKKSEARGEVDGPRRKEEKKKDWVYISGRRQAVVRSK